MVELNQAPGSVASGVSNPKRARRSLRQFEEDEESSLFTIIKNGRCALQQVADEWIQQYKQDRDTALVRLLQFFISCSGCKGRITMEMYHNDNYTEIIRKMTEEFDEDSGEYPLIMTGPTWRKFRSSMCDFVSTLIRQCQYSIIYDQFMTDTVISLLTGLTDSQVRAFRHTSTLAAMKLVTALVEVALSVSINLDNTQRQYDAERTKAQNRRATDRLDGLLASRQKLRENLEEIRTMITYLFKGVFVHRYRDSQPEIRSICMQEIGIWMGKMPNLFLEDSYLKYIGWTLYDRVPEVRLNCLKTLHPLYEDPNAAERLELFSSRFKVRLLEMTLDKETDVAVEAVRCITSMLRNMEQVLDDKDAENIYELVYSSHRQLAVAAAEFLNLKLFQIDEHAPVLRTKKGKRRSQNTPLLRDLVQFFIESELNEHAAYLVDSFFDINTMLRDWEAMLDLLLEEPGRGEEAMDDQQETALIEILASCAKQAATGESPVGRVANRKALNQRQLQDDRRKLTEKLIPALAQLVLKYGEDTAKMLNLLSLVQYMELDLFTTTRQEKHLDLLLKYMQESIEKHTNTEVLLAFAKVFECLTADELQISNKCMAVHSTLMDRLAESYRQSFANYFHEERPDEDDKFALLAALKRIFAFYSYHDLTAWDLWSSLLTIVRSAQERPFYYEEIVAKGIGCAYFALFWRQHRLLSGKADRAEHKELKKCADEFFQSAGAYLAHEDKAIACEAFTSVCDLLVVFGRQAEPEQAVIAVSIVPDAQLQASLIRFLQRRVFVQDEADTDEDVKIEELHNRRTYLACYAKLIIYNCLPMHLASHMLMHYVTFYNDFGDIMKATLQRCKEINKRDATHCIAVTLQKAFSEQLADAERAAYAASSLKELARRFNLSFGIDAMKVREQMFYLHEECVKFCLSDWPGPSAEPPQTARFFDVISELSNKLIREDKLRLANWLRTGWQVPAGSEQQCWRPLNNYLISLESIDAMPDSALRPPAATATAGAGRGRGKRIRDSTASSISGASSVSNGRATTPMAPGQPQAASTAVKRARRDLNQQQQPQHQQHSFPGGPTVQLRSHYQVM